mmetsp:Transcript_2803/g.6553  ORF Transcript_2803/g.6553 Transcript_2803/m.6553 type:complete len:218 (-) Transcript_2803:498-1151(-)
MRSSRKPIISWATTRRLRSPRGGCLAAFLAMATERSRSRSDFMVANSSAKVLSIRCPGGGASATSRIMAFFTASLASASLSLIFCFASSAEAIPFITASVLSQPSMVVWMTWRRVFVLPWTHEILRPLLPTMRPACSRPKRPSNLMGGGEPATDLSTSTMVSSGSVVASKRVTDTALFALLTARPTLRDFSRFFTFRPEWPKKLPLITSSRTSKLAL